MYLNTFFSLGIESKKEKDTKHQLNPATAPEHDSNRWASWLPRKQGEQDELHNLHYLIKEYIIFSPENQTFVSN